MTRQSLQALPAVALKPLTEQMAPALFQLTQVNRDYLRQWLPWLDFNKTVRDTLQYILYTQAQSLAGAADNYGIYWQEQLCGVAGYNEIVQPHRRASLGYWLGEAFTGKGVATAVVDHLVDKGFRTLKLNKIEIHCATENTRSRAVAERLGFSLEGILRQREWLYDHFVDHAIYGLLAEDAGRSA